LILILSCIFSLNRFRLRHPAPPKGEFE
jgi:hypothetical protein